MQKTNAWNSVITKAYTHIQRKYTEYSFMYSNSTHDKVKSEDAYSWIREKQERELSSRRIIGL